MSVLDVKALSFAYPNGKNILHAIDLTIAEGEFILLCGPSGCGKTTLLRCMKAQIAPVGTRKGSVSDLPAKEIGYVFQNPENQIVTDTVRHELAFGLENMGLQTETIRRRVAETALFFGIDEWIDASVYEISGGQKQLLNLASVIAMRPKLLLLDEPVSQLDPLARKNFLDVLLRVNRELGIAVVLSEHHLEEMLPLADRVLFMEAGAFHYEGDAQGYVRYMKRRRAEQKKKLYGLESGIPAAAEIACFWEQDGKEAKVEKLPLTVREGRQYLGKKKEEGKEIGQWDQQIEKLKERYRKKESVKERGTKGSRKNVCLLIDHIWFQYQKQTPFVLKGLELRIERGEFHVILGGNGSGKTTLLSILGKRLYANRGKIRLGEDRKLPRIALLPQNPKAMFSRDTVEEELQEAGCTEELVEALGLLQLLSQHPYDLSGGEQQRLGLAMVLAKEPDLLLLDEPTKGLDGVAKKRIGDDLETYVRQGHTVLCVTHDVDFAAAYADVCSLLFEGEILSTESAQTFFEDNAFYTTDADRILRGI